MDSRQAQIEEFVINFNISSADLLKLTSACDYSEVITCLELLKAKSHKRSSFRASCAEHIQRWLRNESVTIKPLSRKQFELAKPSWPIKYNLP